MNCLVNDDKGITIEMFNQKKLLNVKKKPIRNHARQPIA